MTPNPAVEWAAKERKEPRAMFKTGRRLQRRGVWEGTQGMRSAKHAKGHERKARRGASGQLRRSGIFVERTHPESTQPLLAPEARMRVAGGKLGETKRTHRIEWKSVRAPAGRMKWSRRLASCAPLGREMFGWMNRWVRSPCGRGFPPATFIGPAGAVDGPPHVVGYYYPCDHHSGGILTHE